MSMLLRLIPIVMFSAHAAEAAVRQEVDALVAQLPKLAETSSSFRMEIPERGPVKGLLDLGIEAIPFLVPHLSNLEMTASFRTHGSGRSERISVNEFVGHVITRSSGHYFYIASGEDVSERLGDRPIGDPGKIALYQKQVEKWHEHFGHWKESERRLIDINDWFHYNRFNAYRFFAKHPSPKSNELLRARVGILLTEPRYSSMTASELVSCAEAIAAMGNAADLELVKEVWTNEFEKPMNTSGREDKVKRLFQARVKLGDQQQAKADVDAYNSKYSGRFPPVTVE